MTQQAIEIRVKPTLAVNMCDPIRTRSMFHVRHSKRDGVMPVNGECGVAMRPKREDLAIGDFGCQATSASDPCPIAASTSR